MEIALVDCAVASMVNVAQAYLATEKAPERQGNAHLQIVPYELFATSDGWLVLAVGNDRQWRAFLQVARDVGVADATLRVMDDGRYRSNAARVREREVLVPLVAASLRSCETTRWRAALDAAGVPNGPVWDFAALFASDLATERRLRVTARRRDGSEVPLLRSPLVDDVQPLPPPQRGEHTEQVLQDILGMDAGAIARLKAEGVL